MEVIKKMGGLTHIQQQTALVLRKLEYKYTEFPDQKGVIGAKPGFQERAVTKAIEQAFRINNNAEVKGALTRLFGQELAALDIPLTNVEGEKVNLYDALIENVLDGGTIKDRSCLVPFGGELVPFNEKASPILTRSAFISRVLGEHRKQNELRKPNAEGGPSEHHVSIGMIDLHNLRGADFEIKGQTDKPADVLVNKAARAIRDAFKALGYTNPDKLERENKSWELGRYGGDEFVFGLFGDFSQDEREALYKEIQKQLASDKNMSYYRYLEASGDPVIKKERILLKELNANHDVVDVIQFPDDHEPFLTERRQMFREYLERGLLLSSDEFAKVVKKYSSTGVFSFTEYKMDYPEKIANQPDDIFGLENRINYIRKQHPELSHYFDLAEVYDLENKSLIRRQILLELVENSLFDRLIGEAIYSRDQFQKFLKEGEFSTVITVDLKFIKEINEKMSYADADMAIKSVWELIKDSLTPEDREKIIVGRFGGTFVLGIRQGETINERALYNLQHITGITFGHGINTFHVPVAMTNTDLTAINEKQVDSDQNEIFKNILKENETQFYERLLLDILEEDMMMRTVPRFIGYLKHANLELIPNDIPLTKRDLYALYLRGKRKLERLPKLQSVYHFNQDGDYTDSLLDIDRLHKEFIDSVNIFRLYSSGYVGSVDVPKEELRARVEFLNSIHT